MLKKSNGVNELELNNRVNELEVGTGTKTFLVKGQTGLANCSQVCLRQVGRTGTSRLTTWGRNKAVCVASQT